MERTLTNTTQSKKNAATPVKGNLFFQPKLTINQPDNVYEQQADAVADQVMKMPHPFVQAKPMTITPVQRTCAACENEEKKIQLKEKEGAEKEGDAALESYVSGLSASGSPLPNEVKNFYQPRFGYDFNNVKIHTDSIAAKSAQSINALAYTSGNNIVFNSGQFSPDTDSGKRLLGHELTHVVQQKEVNAKSSIQRWNFDNAPIGDPMRDPSLRDHRPHGVDHGTDESVMDAVIIGAVMGEFNEDPSLAQIALDTGISLIPGVDQVADARDITAHLYFMIFRGEIISPMRWLLFCLSLIGLIPEFGSAIKGAGRVVVNGATAVLARLADILEPFRRFIPDILDYRRMVDFINSNWSNIVLFVRDSYRTITANLHALTTSFWLRITSVADNIVRQIDELYTGGSALIDDALVRLNSLFMEIREAVMNPHALTDSGMSMPIPERGATHMEMSSLGSGGSVSRAARRIAGNLISDPVLLASLRRSFDEVESFRRGVTLPPARTASGNPTISRLDIAGENVYGVSTSAASPSRNREEIQLMQTLVREAYGMAPHRAVMEHAEVDAVISAFNRNLSAESAYMFVDRPLCGFCSTSLRRILPLVGMRELTIYQLVPETGEIWEFVVRAVN